MGISRCEWSLEGYEKAGVCLFESRRILLAAFACRGSIERKSLSNYVKSSGKRDSVQVPVDRSAPGAVYRLLGGALSHARAPIPPLVALEPVHSAWRAAWRRTCSAPRICSAIAETRIEAAIHRAPPVARPAKPWSGADEGAVVEPRGPVVAIRCAAVRRKVKVAVRTDGRGTDVNAEADLRYCIGSCHCSQQNSC